VPPGEIDGSEELGEVTGRPVHPRFLPGFNRRSGRAELFTRETVTEIAAAKTKGIMLGRRSAGLVGF